MEPSQWMNANRSWIRQQVRRGADIYDIGRSPYRIEKELRTGVPWPSKYYNMERYWVHGYRGYQRRQVFKYAHLSARTKALLYRIARMER
jgi:hypothetical protein